MTATIIYICGDWVFTILILYLAFLAIGVKIGIGILLAGFAVGMATNMPPHNLREIAVAVSAYVDNPDISIDELMTYIKGPDFPTGGMILGTMGIREAYTTGRGRIMVRAHAEIEGSGSKTRIIIHEIGRAHV